MSLPAAFGPCPFLPKTSLAMIVWFLPLRLSKEALPLPTSHVEYVLQNLRVRTGSCTSVSGEGKVIRALSQGGELVFSG